MVKFVLNPVPPNMCFLTFFAEVTSFHSEVNFLGVYFIINLQFTLMKPTRTYKNVQDSPQNAGPLDCTLRKMRISLEQIAQCFFNFGHRSLYSIPDFAFNCPLVSWQLITKTLTFISIWPRNFY